VKSQIDRELRRIRDSDGPDESADTGGFMRVRNGGDAERDTVDDAIGEIGLLPTYREKQAAMLDLADILRKNDKATMKELEMDFMTSGEDSVVGGLLGALNATDFLPIMGLPGMRQSRFRALQLRQGEWADKAVEYAGLIGEMADSLEAKIKSGSLTDIDKAFLHGDVSGLKEADVDFVIAKWQRMSFLTPGQAIDMEGGFKAFVVNASQAVDPTRYVSEAAIGGSVAAWNTARNFQRFTEAVPELLRKAAESITADFTHPLANPVFQGELEQVAKLAFRLERSAMRMVEQLGVKKLGKVAKVLPKSVQKWFGSKQGGLNVVLGALTEGAVEMALEPLVQAGFYKSMTARYKYGPDKGIDRVLTTNSGQNLYIEIKGSTGSHGSFSYAQRQGAAKYIPRTLGEVAKRSPNLAARESAMALKRGLEYRPASGYAFVGLHLYSIPSNMRFEIRTWDKNVSATKYVTN
jgi:hypothetical protein